MSTPIPPSTLLEGFGVLLHFLLEAEADCLCGVSLYQRSEQRTNYRSGYYSRKLLTHLGAAPLRVVHLKYFHPRPSLLKRAKRLSSSILDSLAQIHSNGATPDQASALIKTLWVIHLPDELLQLLTYQLIGQLEAWRAGVRMFLPHTASNLEAQPACDLIPPSAPVSAESPCAAI